MGFLSHEFNQLYAEQHHISEQPKDKFYQWRQHLNKKKDKRRAKKKFAKQWKKK